MSAPTQVRPRPPAADADTPSTASPGHRLGAPLLTLGVLALVAAACATYTRVFVGTDFVAPLAVAVVGAVGLGWLARLLGLGSVSSLVLSVAGWAAAVTAIYAPETGLAGVVPTPDTLSAGVALWQQGLELIQVRPAPVYPEPGIMLIALTGVWGVAHAIDGLVLWLRAPLRAIALALVLWAVPLAMAPPGGRVWPWALPLLLAAAGVLLGAGGADLSRWGAVQAAGARSGRLRMVLGAGWPVALLAVTSGALLAGLVPGFGDAPWWELRGRGGTTITTNPMVSIRPNLVSNSDQELLQVETDDPVYLRLTALDQYANEEWTSDGISGGRAWGPLPLETDIAYLRELDVTITPTALDDAVLVPTPYHPTRISGELGEGLAFDPDGATLTIDSGLAGGQGYEISAALPAPPAEELGRVTQIDADPALTALPASVPEAVTALADQIVADAGAETPFAQALAVQEELRSWEYSLEPPPGHGASAMEDFITQRIGYCEQYAGTMAVMLRGLGVPARVAVGFTPGEELDEGEGVYQVTNANAHAWVEALFPGLGWIAFEPTPRVDGNVLVPSATNLAPTETAAQPEPDPADASLAEDTGLTPEQEQALLEQQRGERGPDASPAPGATSASGGPGDGSARAWPWVLGLVLLAGGSAVEVRRRRRSHQTAPAARILAAFGAVERSGRTRGIVRRPHETDRELLTRITSDLGRRTARVGRADQLSAQDRLAWSVEVARYAKTCASEQARRAELASGDLCDALRGDTSPAQRVVGSVRAAMTATSMRARALRGAQAD